MSEIITITLAIILTVSYSMTRWIVTKVACFFEGRSLRRYAVYVWGAVAFAAAGFLKDNFVYALPVIDKLVIYKSFVIVIANMVVTKYSGYRPSGRFDILNFSIAYPIIEEVIFRGLMLPILNKSFKQSFFSMEIAFLPLTFSVVISAFLFAIAHLQYYKLDRISLRYMLWAFIGGMFFGSITDYTQSIFIPVLLHIEFNLMSAYYSYRHRKNPQ